jgi:hypothetical protein
MAKRTRIFARITKVDASTREVWGQAVAEVADKSGEIFDYAGSRPLFDQWSAGFEKSTDGKSLGNLRAMHGKVAAGKLIAYQPDDAEKVIDIGTKVVDDAEWLKVEEGVYTGFSIGGEYVKRWKDPNDPTLTRYIANPVEISLVDNPCVPTATFSMVKADGVIEERAFQSPELTVHGIVAKGLWSVSRLADLLQSIQYLGEDTAWEATYEGDGSGVPAQLRAWLADGVTILTAMVAEEGAEAVSAIDASAPIVVDVVELAATGDLGKAADSSPNVPNDDDERIATIIAKVLRESDLSAPTLQKSIDAAVEKATTAMREQLEAATAANAALQKRVDELAAQPATPKGVVRAAGVTKAQDGAPANNDPPAAAANAPMDAMKDALSRPIVLPPGMQLRDA